MQKITTFLMFESQAKEAVELYVSVFKNSKITSSNEVPGENAHYNASFTLDGQEFMAMNGGPHFKFEQGTSLFVSCEDQAEVDYFWDKLGEGGKPGRCGWLTDKFGVTWQIIPKALGELMSDPDREKTGRVMEAMLKMDKIDVDVLKQAYTG